MVHFSNNVQNLTSSSLNLLMAPKGSFSTKVGTLNESNKTTSSRGEESLGNNYPFLAPPCKIQ